MFQLILLVQTLGMLDLVTLFARLGCLRSRQGYTVLALVPLSVLALVIPPPAPVWTLFLAWHLWHGSLFFQQAKQARRLQAYPRPVRWVLAGICTGYWCTLGPVVHLFRC